MTADVIALRREADAIAARHPDILAREACKAAHPSSRPVFTVLDRQQAVNALVCAAGDGRLDLNDDADLPLIVMTLLVCCPQARREPAAVAKTLADAVAAQRRSLVAERLGLDDDARREAADAVFLAGQLVRGEAVANVAEYAMDDCSTLRDYLATVRR